MNRRTFLNKIGQLSVLGALFQSSSIWAHDEAIGLFNPFEQGIINNCSRSFPKTNDVQRALKKAWSGLDPAQVWGIVMCI